MNVLREPSYLLYLKLLRICLDDRRAGEVESADVYAAISTLFGAVHAPFPEPTRLVMLQHAAGGMVEMNGVWPLAERACRCPSCVLDGIRAHLEQEDAAAGVAVSFSGDEGAGDERA